MINRILALLLTLTLCLRAEDKAPTLAEAKAAFAKADKELNAVWEKAKIELSETRFAQLRGEQRDWVEWRDTIASAPTYSGETSEEAAKNSPGYFSTAADLTKSRTDWLRGLVSKAPLENMTGTWTDSYGGHINIVEKDGKLNFVIECVRGHSAHVGALAGVASWNDTIGWFSDKGRDKGKQDETNLAFVLNGVLEVHGAKTSEYHGARAYFDGDYVKTGNLTDKAAALVINAAKAGDPMLEEEAK